MRNSARTVRMWSANALPRSPRGGRFCLLEKCIIDCVRVETDVSQAQRGHNIGSLSICDAAAHVLSFSSLHSHLSSNCHDAVSLFIQPAFPIASSFNTADPREARRQSPRHLATLTLSDSHTHTLSREFPSTLCRHWRASKGQPNSPHRSLHHPVHRPYTLHPLIKNLMPQYARASHCTRACSPQQAAQTDRLDPRSLHALKTRERLCICPLLHRTHLRPHTSPPIAFTPRLHDACAC